MHHAGSFFKCALPCLNGLQRQGHKNTPPAESCSFLKDRVPGFEPSAAHLEHPGRYSFLSGRRLAAPSLTNARSLIDFSLTPSCLLYSPPGRWERCPSRRAGVAPKRLDTSAKLRDTGRICREGVGICCCRRICAGCKHFQKTVWQH